MYRHARSAKVIAAIARNPNTPDDVLVKIYNSLFHHLMPFSAGDRVKAMEWVSRNPNTPTYAYLSLAGHQNLRVATAAQRAISRRAQYGNCYPEHYVAFHRIT